MRKPPNISKLGKDVLKFCQSMQIPPEYFVRIIKDQKVAPMLRGKGMEYSVYLALKSVLDEDEWSVEKMNLSAQLHSPDEDIRITYRRTDTRLKVESKSSARGTFNLGTRAKTYKGQPQFRVKCHRSRSNIEKVGKGNDRYSVTDFDLILSNLENAIYQKNTVSESLELLYDTKAIAFLKKHYNVRSTAELIQAAYEDWRFVFPKEIGERGLIPRTPLVKLIDDPHWHPLSELPDRLREFIREQHQSRSLR